MKKTLAIMLALIMVLALVPTVAFAETYVAWIGETGYETLEAAVNAAESGATITLGEGEYTLYEKNANVLNKDLTFVGQGADKTTYHIGAKDTSHPDGPCDYSLDGRGTDMKETVTFKDMTIDAGKYPKAQTERAYLHGLAGIDNIVLDNCIFNGIASYWGYATTKFNNVIFNAPGTEASGIEDVDYSLWTWTGTEYTFNNCTFNSAGKVINAYRGNPDGTAENPVGTAKNPIVLNFNDCEVVSSKENKSVLNIKDANNYYTVNISGTNTVEGLKPNKITCSRLFQVEGWANNYNLSGGKGSEVNNDGNSGKTTVYIDNTLVWTGGKMVSHAIGTQYTDGYKDDEFDIIPISDGVYVKKCKYCGYTELFYGELSNEIELTRTVMQGQEVNANPKDTYKVNGSSNITVDYTATMDMKNLEWRVDDATYNKNNKYKYNDQDVSPWELLMALALTDKIDGGRTEVILTFKFDNIDLKAFKDKYEDNQNVLELESTMFEMKDVAFGPDNTMTITCKWKENAITDNSTITLKGCGLPVEANWGESKQINIENRGCVKGMVHINPRGGAAVAMAEPAPNVAANQESIPTPSLDTIQIPIVGGCKTDEFTLYYGGGSSSDSSGGSSSGGGYHYPTTTPVPVIVIPPKTGDMTVWQSILHFLGIK